MKAFLVGASPASFSMTARKAGLGQQFLRLGWIIDRRWGFPVVVEILRHDPAGVAGQAQRQRPIDGLGVDRQESRLAHAHAVPGQLYIPVVGKVTGLRRRERRASTVGCIGGNSAIPREAQE